MNGRIEERLGEIMRILGQRGHESLRKNFQLTLRKKFPGVLDVMLEGNSLNLNQGGAFIKTEGWIFRT